MLSFRNLLFLATAAAAAQKSCSLPNIPFTYKTPVVAPGYTARLVGANFYVPRGMIFDTAGRLLVVQQGKGILSVTLQDDGGSCVGVASNKTLVDNSDFTHGIEISPDGKTLYASTLDKVYAWDYDPATSAVSNNRTLVTGMDGSDHITRTLLLSTHAPGKMIVSRGSTENVDLKSLDKNSGISQIKYFDLAAPQIREYGTQGTNIGWGLRNSVGIAEHPNTGGLWSVENSVDEMVRLGVNIHEHNPGEELNYHGTLTDPNTKYFGRNYGYPYCFAAWNVTEIPENTNLVVGSNFAIGDMNSTVNDNFCQNARVAPRLTFPPHWAPLDIKFNPAGTTAWITAHGSWNSDVPVGYQVFQVAFDPKTGSPLQPSTSTTHMIPIMQNANTTECPDNCFRPVAFAWDTKGRIYFSNDMQGEVYVITKSDGSGVQDIAAPANTTVMDSMRRL